MATVMVVYGTRPEAIKMAPVVAALERSPGLEPIVVVTGQHREMLDQVNELFGIRPAKDLDIIAPRQTLEQITVRALAGLGEVIRAERPDMVAVQGDTTTSFAAALAAFYEKIPVVHVEAGLRTCDRYSPFPEEINRRLTSQIASVHLAPTSTSRANLLAEHIAPESHRGDRQHRHRRAVRRCSAACALRRPAAGGGERTSDGARDRAPARVVGRADGALRIGHRAARSPLSERQVRAAGASEPSRARGADSPARRRCPMSSSPIRCPTGSSAA